MFALTKKSKYRVICESNINIDQKSLLMLYQPLIGASGVAIYMTLIFEADLNKSIGCYRLCALTQKNLLKISNYLIKLNNLNLIDIYQQESSNQDQFIIKINKPLSFQKFNKNLTMKEDLIKRLNINNFKIVKKQFDDFETNDFTNFKIIKKLNNFNAKNENQKTKLINNIKKSDIVEKTKLIFQLETIANLYKFSYDILNNIIFTHDCQAKEIEEKKINILIYNYWTKNNKINAQFHSLDKMTLMRSASIIEFLNMRIKKTLTPNQVTFLINLYALNIDSAIKNLVIDYSLIKNKRIVNSYIDKIVKTLITLKIEDFDDAVIYLKNAFNAKNNSEIIKV